MAVLSWLWCLCSSSFRPLRSTAHFIFQREKVSFVPYESLPVFFLPFLVSFLSFVPASFVSFVRLALSFLVSVFLFSASSKIGGLTERKQGVTASFLCHTVFFSSFCLRAARVAPFTEAVGT